MKVGQSGNGTRVCATTNTRLFNTARLVSGLVGAYNERPHGDSKVQECVCYSRDAAFRHGAAGEGIDRNVCGGARLVGGLTGMCVGEQSDNGRTAAAMALCCRLYVPCPVDAGRLQWWPCSQPWGRPDGQQTCNAVGLGCHCQDSVWCRGCHGSCAQRNASLQRTQALLLSSLCAGSVPTGTKLHCSSRTVPCYCTVLH